MNCREFDEKLHLIVWDPPEPLRGAAQHHASGCPRCRRLLSIARGEDAEETTLADDTAEDSLTDAILRRTSGPTCALVEERLSPWIDGETSGFDADLISEHLAHCAGCRDLANSLAELIRDLPRMAEAEPDPMFVREVLDATSRRAISRPRLLDAVESRWTRLLRRPRIAMELAYGATMILLVIFGAHPNRPTILSGENSVTVRAASDLTRSAETVSTLLGRFGEEIGSAQEEGPVPAVGRHVREGLHPLKLSARRTGGRLTSTLEVSVREGRRVIGALLHWDTIEAWSAFQDFKNGIHKSWNIPEEGTEPSGKPARISRQTTGSSGPPSGAILE
jgi:hypothetical protein